MNKQTIINRLEALDLSQYPYFEIKEDQRKNLRDFHFMHII